MAKNYWDLKYFDKDTLAFVDTIAQVENIADAPFIFNRNFEISSTEYLLLPSGTTAQRPTPQEGYLRYNTTESEMEFYDGTSWEAITASVGGGSDAENIVFKSEDTDSNTTTFAADADLTLPVDASTTYYWEVRLLAENTNANAPNPQLKFQLAGPTGCTIYGRSSINEIFNDAGGTTNSATFTNNTTNSLLSCLVCFGFADISTTSGSLTVEWAQNTLNATNPVILKEKSFLRLYTQ